MLKKISNVVYNISGVIISIALAMIVILVFAQVMSRYFFQFPISWGQELTTFLMIWMVFLGCSMGLRQGEVVALTFLQTKLPEKASAWISFSAKIILIIFLIVCIYFNNEIVKFSMMQLSPMLKIPMGWIALSLTVSFVLMVFYSLIDIIDFFENTFSVSQVGK